MALTIQFRPVLDAADLFRRADRDLQAQMRRTAAREINPWLQSAIRRAGALPQDRKIAGSARVRTGLNPAVVIGSGARFSGGATTGELVRVYEFGGNREQRSTHRSRSRKGSPYTVHDRATQRQIPWRRDSGRFVYPAVAQAAPMLVRAWADVIRETYEGRAPA